MIKNNEPLLPDFLNFDVYPFDEKGWEDWCQGTNEKETLIIISAADNTDELTAFLTKIIGAVKYDLARDTLLCVLPDDRKLSLQTILKKQPIKKVLIFGVGLKKLALHLQFPLYQPIKWNSLELLQADPLSKIAKNTPLKGALWNALQAIFL